jgi:hypothetical protein
MFQESAKHGCKEEMEFAGLLRVEHQQFLY